MAKGGFLGKIISLFIYNVKATHFFGIVSSKAILKGFRQIFVNPLTLSSGKNYLQANSMCFTGIKLLLRLFYCTVLYSLYICTVLGLVPGLYSVMFLS